MTPSLRPRRTSPSSPERPAGSASALMQALTGARRRGTGTIRALVTNRPSGTRCGAVAGRRAVVGDVTDADSLEPLFAGLAGAIDVIHTAGVIHPRRVVDFERINAGGTASTLDRGSQARASGASCTSRRTARSAPTPSGRHVPQRGAVPPVLRLRAVEDGRRAGACFDAVEARTRRRDRAPAVVLRPPPAVAPDDVLQARAHRAASP